MERKKMHGRTTLQKKKRYKLAFVVGTRSVERTEELNSYIKTTKRLESVTVAIR